MDKRYYRDLLIRIEGSDGGYEVSLHHFPLPEDSASPPIAHGNASLTAAESESLRRNVNALRNRVPPRNTAEETGKLLRKLLFPRAVWNAFCEILERSEKEGRHVRIRLLVEVEDLKSHPWEAVFIEEWNSFLALHDLVSFTRLLSDETPLVHLAPMEKLRVLVIGCDHGDESKHPPLPALPKVDMELQTLRNVLDKLVCEGLVYYEVLFNPTKEDVEEKLKEGWHVVFYSGHGVIEPVVDDSFLLLDDGEGKAAYWLLSELADSVSESELTRLVILNCCEVGIPAGEILINSGGVKAVMAMQFILSDEAGIGGSEVLFRTLANRLPIDEAVYRYRESASGSYTRYAEHCTPVLFLQASDGMLFASPDKLARGNYLRFLSTLHTFMPSLDPQKPLRMEDFYVKLRLGKEIERKTSRVGNAHPEMEERETILRDFRVWQERGEAMERELEPVEVEDVLRTKRRIVVKGDPGSGKTTLVKNICFNNSHLLLSEGVPDKKRTIPVMVRLNELSEEMKNGGDFPSYLQRSLSGSGLPSDFVQNHLKKWLENGECIVLFDGLDEVVENRGQVIFHLQTLASGLLRECTLLLTTRIVGYANEMSGWEHYELLSFQDEDIEQFLKCYFADENEKAGKLLGAIKQSGEIKTLATNPLLLKLICFVFEAENLTLPMRRVELYDRATHHILEMRQTEYPESDKRIPLEAIALHFFERGKEIFDETELSETIQESVFESIPRRMRDTVSYDYVETKSRALLDEILNKSGLLYRTSGGRYTFLHLTFQEYFAASALARTEEESFLDWKKDYWSDVAGDRNCIFDPRWEEVLRLLAAKVTDATPMVQAIQNGGDDIFRRRLCLAAKCVGEAREVNLESAQSICHELARAWEEGLRTKIEGNTTDAMRVLGSSPHGKRLIAGLVKALEDENEFVRMSAADALGKVARKNKLIIYPNGRIERISNRQIR